MLGLLGELVVFALLAVILLNMLGGETEGSVAASLLLWAACLVHADSVLSAAYLDLARVPVPAAVGIVLGGPVGVAGFVLFGWATRTLVREGSFDGLRAERLVRAGPYALMRHPQHVGWTLMLLGVALVGRSLVGLGLVAIFALFASRLALAEERDLAARFGASFERWRATTPPVPRPRRPVAPA